MSEPPAERAEPDLQPAADALPTDSGSVSGDRSHLPSLGPHGEGWFVLQIVFMVGIVVAGYVFSAHLSGAPRFAVSVAGGALILAGFALVALGIKDLDRSVSPLPRPRNTAVLIQVGVYKRIRHPIYAGLILLALGWSLLMASLVALALALAFAVLLDLKARREEVWLRARYPGYAEYAQYTRRFVPGVY